jgi:hypothetical protein
MEYYFTELNPLPSRGRNLIRIYAGYFKNDGSQNPKH